MMKGECWALCLRPCKQAVSGHYHFIVVRDNMKLGVIVNLLNDRDSLLEDLGQIRRISQI